MSIRAFLLQPPIRNSNCVYFWRFFHAALESSDHQATTRKFSCGTMPLKGSCIPLAVSSSRSRLYPLGAVLAEACESSDVISESNNHPNSHYSEARGEVVGVTCHLSEPAVTCSTKENQRRQKIGLANKGKIPWNKGRKHSPETCARIKQKTLEALKDPKVRKKMSESPHMHSELSKRKIGSSLKKLWAKRLKQKRSKELFYSSWAVSIAEAARRGGIDEEEMYWDSYEGLKVEMALQKLWPKRLKRKHSKELFYSSWAESIAEAARRGGIDEEEMYWDSYERSKVEMAFQRLQWDEEKTQEQESKRIEAEKQVHEREHKRNAELTAKKKVRSRRGRKKKKVPAASGESIITDKSTKILRKKSIGGLSSSGVMIYLQSALEKFDIESIKAEQKRSKISLADQIQAAKSKRLSVSSGSTTVQ